MSKLINCPTCGEQVSSGAENCPHCGETIRKNKPRSVIGGFISLALGLLLCIVCVAIDDTVEETYRLLGGVMLIIGIVAACICFTSPSK